MAHPNITLSFGEDLPSLRDELHRWQKAFIQKHGSHNLEELNADGKKMKVDWNSLLKTSPFLSEKRLVILKGCLEELDSDSQVALKSALEGSPESTIVLFVEWKNPDKRKSLYQWLSKEALIKIWKKPEEFEYKNWISRRAEKYQFSLSSDLAEKILRRLGSDLNAIDQALLKLSYWAADHEIDEESLNILVPSQSDDSVFQLTDALGQSGPAQIVGAFRRLLKQGEDVNFIFAMLARHFRLLLEAKSRFQSGENSASLAKNLAIPPFLVQKILKQSQNFSEKKLTDLLAKLLDLDRRLKSSQIQNTRDNSHFSSLLEGILRNSCLN